MCIPPGQPLAEFLPHTRQDFRALSEVLWNVAGQVGMLYTVLVSSMMLSVSLANCRGPGKKAVFRGRDSDRYGS